MVNTLTADFDAVVQVRLKTVNGILANLHRNGSSPDKSPSLLHSFTIPVGPPGASGEGPAIVSWANNYDFATIGEQTREVSLQSTPPGVLQAVDRAIAQLNDDDGVLHPLPRPFGKAQVQASTPTVSFPANTTSDVTSNFSLRGKFLPGISSPMLGEPVHGIVRATFRIDLGPGLNSQTLLEVTPSQDDADIVFEPASGSGLNAAEVQDIAMEIRYALRNRFEPMSVELDEGFPFSGFKSLGSGTAQTVSLPATINGVGPAAGPAGISTQFLKTNDDFGVAIAKEFLNPILQPMLDSLKATGFQFAIVVLGVTLATYTVAVSSASLEWKNGELEVSTQGSATTSSLFPNYNFTVVQRLALEFTQATQFVKLVAVGDPVITGLPSFAMATAMAHIKSERDAAIAQAQPQVRDALINEISLVDGLTTFDGIPSMEYTAVEIEPRGVILRGEVTGDAAPTAIVDLKESSNGSGFTALDSWIPGGWIERYLWSWKEGGFSQNPWGVVIHSTIQEHSFLLPEPASHPHVNSVCLAIEGTRTASNGSVSPIEAGDVCKVSVPGWVVATLPPFWDLFLPIWESNPSPEAILDDAIQAHVNALAHARSRTRLGANTIVHFAGDALSKPLDELTEALGVLRNGELPVALCLVLPTGSLGDQRRAVEERLGTLGRELGVWFSVTEDYEGQWSRAFGSTKNPTTFAMNARGEFVWKHQGPPKAKSFHELERHLIPGLPLRNHQVRLAVRSGERAPGFMFPLQNGKEMPLRRLRNRRVLLNFWKSWSSPCLAELKRLQALHQRGDKDAPVIIAINGGEDERHITKTREELGLTFPLVADLTRSISRRYGVQCWPTTVSIDEGGLIETSNFGAKRCAESSPARK